MEILGERPVWSMSDSEKLSRLDAVFAVIARLETYGLHLIGDLDASGYAKDIGAGDTARFLSTRYRIDPAKARRDVRLAKALTKYEAVAAALPDPATPVPNGADPNEPNADEPAADEPGLGEPGLGESGADEGGAGGGGADHAIDVDLSADAEASADADADASGTADADADASGTADADADASATADADASGDADRRDDAEATGSTPPADRGRAIHPAQAAAIVSALDKVPDTVPVENIQVAERQLVNLARTFTPDQLRDAGERIRNILDTDGPEPNERNAYKRESLTLKPAANGVKFGGYLANENAELLRTMIHAGAKPHKTLDGTPDPRPRDKRQADALTTLLTTAAAVTHTTTPSTPPTARPPAPSPGTSSPADNPAANAGPPSTTDGPAPSPGTSSAADNPVPNAAGSSTADGPAPSPGTSSPDDNPVPSIGTSSTTGGPAPSPGTSSAADDPVPNAGSSSTAEGPTPNAGTSAADNPATKASRSSIADGSVANAGTTSIADGPAPSPGTSSAADDPVANAAGSSTADDPVANAGRSSTADSPAPSPGTSSAADSPVANAVATSTADRPATNPGTSSTVDRPAINRARSDRTSTVPSGGNPSSRDTAPTASADDRDRSTGPAAHTIPTGAATPAEAATPTTGDTHHGGAYIPGHGPKAHLTITIDYHALKTATADAIGDTVFGDSLSAAAVRRIACDAQVIPIVLGSKSQPLDVGTTKRLVTAPMRLALNARDRGCVVCGAPPIQCEAHHLVHWIDGGETCVSNLVLLCKRHHLDLHAGHWHIQIMNGVVQVTRPTWADPAPIPPGSYKPPTHHDPPTTDTPRTGTPASGTPTTDTPRTGTPPTGTRPADTPRTGTPTPRTPPTGTSGVGDPARPHTNRPQHHRRAQATPPNLPINATPAEIRQAIWGDDDPPTAPEPSPAASPSFDPWSDEADAMPPTDRDLAVPHRSH